MILIIKTLETLKDYEEENLKPEEGCRILYDTESVDLMKKLSETKQDYLTLYSDYIVKNGERPSASEFHQFIDKLSQLIKSLIMVCFKRHE